MSQILFQGCSDETEQDHKEIEENIRIPREVKNTKKALKRAKNRIKQRKNNENRATNNRNTGSNVGSTRLENTRSLSSSSVGKATTKPASTRLADIGNTKTTQDSNPLTVSTTFDFFFSWNLALYFLWNKNLHRIFIKFEISSPISISLFSIFSHILLKNIYSSKIKELNVKLDFYFSFIIF